MVYRTPPGPDTLQVCNVLMRKGCLELVDGFNPSKRWQTARETDWFKQQKHVVYCLLFTDENGRSYQLGGFHPGKFGLLHDFANDIDQNESK